MTILHDFFDEFAALQSVLKQSSTFSRLLSQSTKTSLQFSIMSGLETYLRITAQDADHGRSLLCCGTRTADSLKGQTDSLTWRQPDLLYKQPSASSVNSQVCLNFSFKAGSDNHLWLTPIHIPENEGKPSAGRWNLLGFMQ